MSDPTVVDTPSVGQIPKNIVSNSADLTLVLVVDYPTDIVEHVDQYIH